MTGIGDVVTTAEELDALPVGAVVLDDRENAFKLGTVTNRYASRFAPLTVLYLPDQPPRPERVVKAEAMREWAQQTRGAYPEDIFIPPTPEALAAVHADCKKRGGTLDAVSAHVMRHAARIADMDADRIERGDLP